MSGASGGPAPKPSWDPWGLRAAIGALSSLDGRNTFGLWRTATWSSIPNRRILFGALYRTAAKVTGIGVEGGSSRWLNRLSPASEDMAENRLRFI